jgi:hypothetical protein
MSAQKKAMSAAKPIRSLGKDDLFVVDTQGCIISFIEK